MSRRGGTRVRATRKPVIILAGEDGNDRKSLRILLEAFCPDMRGRIIEINDSVRLRQASGETLRSRVITLANKVRARAAREDADVACVFIHEDFDAADSDAYQTVRNRIQDALDASFDTAHYVLAVWEIEAWLLLFPDSLSAFVSSWTVPAKYRNKDTGRLTDPKRILTHEISNGSRLYRESDAPALFDKTVALNCHKTPAGSNRSWDQLQQDVQQCCNGHL